MISPVRIAFLALAALLAGCGQSGDEPLEATVVGKPGAPFESGVRLSHAGQLVRAATTEGLVTLDAQGRVVPALADRWIVTDDGLSYIFRLRDGTWLDGSPLAADTVVSALRKAIAGVKGTPLADDLIGIDTIVARAGRVVEIQLTVPHADLLQVLAQPELGLVRGGRGTGPMRLVRENGVAVLSPIAPGKRGLPAEADWDARIRVMKLRAMAAEQAIARFEDGETSLVLGGRFEGFPLAREVGIARGKLEIDPVTGLFGLAVAGTRGFLADAANREAVAMAIDREAIGSVLGFDGWQPTTRVVAPAMDGDPGSVGERWEGRPIEARQAEAASRVKRWSAAQGAVAVKIALPQGPGADLLFGSLAKDLRAIGIAARRVNEGDPADLRLVDSVARYARAGWFLSQLSCAARAAPCSPAADELAAEARQTVDADRRADLFADAEVELTRSNVFIPLGQPLRWTLLRRDVTGFAPNRWGFHPLVEMTLLAE